MKYIFFLTLAVLFSCCKGLTDEDCYTSIVVRNISNDTISIFHLSSEHFDIKSQHDTILHATKDDYWFTSRTFPQNRCWSASWYKNKDVSQDTITIFIILQSVCENVPWDMIVKDYQILQRYDIPLQYYKEHFSERHPLTYPPSKDMEGIIVRSYE